MLRSLVVTLSVATALPAAPAMAVEQAPGREARAVLIGGSISVADYPPDAIAAGAEGRSVATYTIGRDGRVSPCSASGAGPFLDPHTCKVIQRFRYKPARDGRGKSIPEVRTQSFEWRLPPPPVPEPAAPTR